MEVPESSEQIGSMTIPIIKFTKRNNLEDCMIHQARLAHRLRREITRRYLNKGQSGSADTSEGESSTVDIVTPFFRLMAPGVPTIEHKRVITKLIGVMLHHPEERGPGTLNAVLSAVIYTEENFCEVIQNANVDRCFFDASLLLFHLKHTIMVNGKMTKDIKFYFPGGGSTLAGEVKKFVSKLRKTQLCYRGDVPITPLYFEALDDCQFPGVLPTGGEAILAMTYSSLVIEGIHKPFIVVPLGNIEIVNLALLEPEMIHMTVIFKDFKCAGLNCALFEIHSISLEFLPGIKSRLNFANVKYYVNMEKRDWTDTVRRISESPETFILDRGWESLHLEDDRTLAYYPDADSGSDLEKYGTSIW